MKSDLYLAYVDYIGVNALGYHEYDVFLTDSPDTVWGEDWEQQCPSACGDLKPDETTYTQVRRLLCSEELFIVQENSCFSLQDCIDGCISMCWLMGNDDDLVFKLDFGETFDTVIERISDNRDYFPNFDEFILDIENREDGE